MARCVRMCVGPSGGECRLVLERPYWGERKRLGGREEAKMIGRGSCEEEEGAR